jgi:hypothetical protein
MAPIDYKRFEDFLNGLCIFLASGDLGCLLAADRARSLLVRFDHDWHREGC